MTILTLLNRKQTNRYNMINVAPSGGTGYEQKRAAYHQFQGRI